MGTMPVMLTAAEVAATLRVETSTVYRWLRDGTLASVRVAGTVRIPAAEISTLIRSAATEPEETTT